MVETRVVKVDPFNPSTEAIAEAAEVLRRGGLVAFPTETVYGLGALVYLRESVLRIFRVKKRPLDNPLIVHISKLSALSLVARDVPEEALIIAEKLWPGPVTLVLWKSDSIPSEVTAGLPKVAVRMPAHRVALMLIDSVNAPIAAPSANLSGRPSPTSADHVIKDFYGSIDLVIDAGETLHGVESTIVDLTVKPPLLLRPGALSVEELERVLGIEIAIPPFARGLTEASRAIAPGMKYRHYAPRAEMVLVESRSYDSLTKIVNVVRDIALKSMRKGVSVGILCSDETYNYYTDLGAVVRSLGSRSNLFQVAKNLFKSMRELDEAGVSFIIAEGFEERGLGLTIMNRLRKASGHNIIMADQ
ncbi:MAG: L-threonylcarbamoyladenylate synthase [Desulfurococcaceae archaeon]